jgi:hypothetical protein
MRGVYVRETTEEKNVPRSGLLPLPVAHGGSAMMEHGSAFMAAERNRVLTADGDVWEYVYASAEMAHRKPKGPHLFPLLACAFGIPRGKGHGGTASGSARCPTQDNGAKGTTLASQEACACVQGCTTA